ISTDVDIFFLHWVKTPSIGFQSSFVTSLLSKRGFSFFFFFPSLKRAVVVRLIIISGPFSSPRQAGRGKGWRCAGVVAEVPGLSNTLARVLA
uniref:Uncharacterized protein n=1 Tax=Catharus ustulatus TaxID=91951 RepID=A0A8C3V9U9_CATUS